MKVPEQKVELTVRTIHTGEQYVPAICERVAGHEKIWCLFGNAVEGIQAVAISVRDHDHATESVYKGERYPVERLQHALMQISERGLVAPSAIEVASRLLPGFKPPQVDEPDEDGEVIVQRIVTGDSKTPARTVLASICAALKIDPVDARKRLRAAGMRAPYVDDAAIRKVLEGK